MPMIGSGPIPISQEVAGYQPSTMSTLGQFLFGNNGSWADSKEHLRDIHYQQAMRPIQAQALQQWMARFGGGQPQQAAPDQPTAPEPAAVDPNDLEGMMGAGLGRAVQTAVPSQAATQIVPQAQRRRAIVDINDPGDQSLLWGGEAFGLPGAKTLMDIAKTTQPDILVGPGGEAYDKHDPGVVGQRFRNPTNVNGWISDLNDPNNIGKYLPQLPNGVMPNGSGGVDNITGLVPAMRAQEEAQTLGRTRGTMLNVPYTDGTTGPQLGANYLDGQGQGGSPGPVTAAGPGGGPIVPQRGAVAGRTQRPDDAAYRVESAKAGQGRMQGYVQGGQKAGASLNTYARLQQLDQGVGGGKLAPLGADVASYASSLGIKLDPKLPNKEAIVALTNKLVLDGLGGSLGPGVSNSDVKFLQGMTPSLANTPQGRKTMVTYGIAAAKRQQRVATMASEWERRYGRIDARDSVGRSFEDNLSGWAERNPLVGRR